MFTDTILSRKFQKQKHQALKDNLFYKSSLSLFNGDEQNTSKIVTSRVRSANKKFITTPVQTTPRMSRNESRKKLEIAPVSNFFTN
jgi:hypothetical protein